MALRSVGLAASDKPPPPHKPLLTHRLPPPYLPIPPSYLPIPTHPPFLSPHPHPRHHARPSHRSTASEENGGAAPPADRKCPLDPFVIIPDRSTFIDTQTLKLQEAPEQVPTGEMPRHLLLAAERSLTDKIAPGTRVSVIGVASIFSSAGAGGGSARASAVSVRTPYLRVVGVMVHEEGSGRVVTEFSPEEEARMREMAKTPGLYQVRCLVGCGRGTRAERDCRPRRAVYHLRHPYEYPHAHTHTHAHLSPLPPPAPGILHCALDLG